MLACLGALWLPAGAGASSSPARIWRWGIDYGAATDPAVARGYDLLVLEPDHARPIAPLRGPGSRLLGYISVGEVERRRPFFAQLEKAGALQAANPHWPDARFVDLRHPAWRTLIVDTLVPDILRKGYNGIFMDTLDNAEAMETKDPKGNAGMIAAAGEIVRAIRTRFPDITIMMNRGYALLPGTAKDVDFILAEAMASRWSFADKRYEEMSASDWLWQAERLRAAKRSNPSVELTTLDYWEPSDRATVKSLYERERAAGFHPYVAILALDRLLPEPQ